MRSITLWLGVLACLLVAGQAIQLPNIEEPEEDVLDELADDEDVDMARMLSELFEDEEIDEDDDDVEEETGRQLAEVNTSEQERYNAFMDTLLSQLTRQARRDLEPLKVTLTPAKKDKNDGKKNGRKNSKKNNKKEKNTKKGKNNRKPKEVELPEIADVEQDLHQIQRREAEAEEEVTGKNKKDGNNKEKKNKDGKNKNEKKNKNRKNNNKTNNKRQGRSNNKVVLHGMSHIAREGDVRLFNMKNGRTLITEFTIGPVELDVTRTFGSGEESKATASATKLKGKMKLKINKEGKPKIKNLKIKGPNIKDITTSGSVARGESNSSGKGFIKKSVKKLSPTAAKKLLRAAKAIIQDV